MSKLNRIMLLAALLFAWITNVGAQQYIVEIVKNGQVVFSSPTSEIEYMTVVNRLPTPVNVHGVADNGKVTITWDAVNGATSYKVFRSPDGDSFTPIGTSSTNSYIDDSPLSGSNYYCVQALGASDAQSARSASTQSVANDVQGKSGIYLGVIGFNQKLKYYSIAQLTEGSKQGYYDFIDSFNSDNDGTAIYYAVDQAISTLQDRSYPADLNSVHVVTFTDGIDNYSLDIYDEIEFGRYSDPDECGNYVKSRLATENVQGNDIMGYAVGLKHADVNSARFTATLNRIASSSSLVYEQNNMSAVEAKLKDIALNITEVNKTQNITVSISGGLEDGERIRFTFDLSKSATSLTNSNLYVEGTYRRISTATRKLTNVTAEGLTLKGTEIVGTKNAETGLFDFTFEEVAANNKKLIDTNNTLEWWGDPWQKDTEFNSEINTKTENLSGSAAIILVLDCTKSLGSQFAEMQKSAKSFIATLLSGDKSDYNGHEYVDLGLSVKWATCNVGAYSPSDYGDYFAWGETTPKDTYYFTNSKTYDRSLDEISGNPEYDAARANWGGSWRLPTRAECAELINRCTWTWTSQSGHNGYKVTGPNGNFIFLPAAGYRYGSSLDYAGMEGHYWSSTPYESNKCFANSLYFFSGGHGVGMSSRYYGQSVRPVTE